jgi:hemoglobin-like flavoprotein
MNDSSQRAGVAELPLSPAQVRLLRHSFIRIESQGTIVAIVFYRTLFTLDPSLRSMFHTSLELQARKLMDSLSHTVATLEAPQTLVPVLEGLGRRHVTYGVREEHYQTVISALLKTFAETLGAEFTPELSDAWRQALNFVAAAMQRGARQVEDLKATRD